MTPEQISLVKVSFAELLPRRDEAGKLFYERLFAIAPELKPLFKGNIDNQQKKLMDVLETAISNLRDAPALTAMLHKLGEHHARYGAEPQHYGKVGEALIFTLRAVLGARMTQPVHDAWVALYGAVATTMKTAANRQPTAN